MRKALWTLTVLSAVALSSRSPLLADELKEGDRVAICGDSITERNVYSVYLEDYLLMCRPAPALHVAQFGWSGERSWDFQARLKNDVLPFLPTVATLLYGMNDGGYTRLDNVPLDRYRNAISESIAAFRSAGVRFIVLGSPTLVDPATYKRSSASVYNETLDGFAVAAREEALKQGVAFADIHTTFQDVMKKAKARWGDDYALAGPDGIHPADAGHLVIAWAFLKALGCSGDIGTIIYDFASGQAQGSKNHQILSASGGNIAICSSRYPFCFPPDAPGQHGVRSVLEFLPFNEDLNRFTFRVVHAPEQGVKITWGGRSRVFSKAAVESGINLAAEFPDNPFCKPFLKTEAAIKKQQEMETRIFKGLLHTFVDWQALFPDESQKNADTFARLRDAILAKDEEFFQTAATSIVPVNHIITCEINQGNPGASQQNSAPAGPSTLSFPDVSNDTADQVVVDREPGQYLGHVSTVMLDDGRTVLAVYPKGHGKGPIVYKRSTDGGLTWSDRLPTPESWATSKEIPTLFKTVDREGKHRLLLFSGRMTSFPGEPIRMSVSEDDGKTWSELKPIGNYGGVAAMSSMVRLNDGSYMALFHDEAKFWDMPEAKLTQESRVFKTISQDGGLTWSAPGEIARVPNAFLCEPCAIRSPDGKEIAVLMRENTRKYNSFVIFSRDEGKTWSKPTELPLALTGDRHVAKYLPDGRLFISFRDTAKGSKTTGDWCAWIGTWEDIVNGRDGQFRVRLMHDSHGYDCGYSGVEVLPDATVVATSYGRWSEGQEPYIVAVRLKPAELGKPATSPSSSSSR